LLGQLGGAFTLASWARYRDESTINTSRRSCPQRSRPLPHAFSFVVRALVNGFKFWWHNAFAYLAPGVLGLPVRSSCIKSLERQSSCRCLYAEDSALWRSVWPPGDHEERTTPIERDHLEIARILDAIGRGEERAARDLLPLVYNELRRLAARRLACESPGQTLQATALVHEAYLRVVGPAAGQRWQNRGHFFAAAAEAMRRILVENARRKRRLKHGGGRAREPIELDEVAAQIANPGPEHLLDLDEAIRKLAEVDARAAELVTLRFFAGLTIPQAAEMLGVSPRTADLSWAYARAWLKTELQGDSRVSPHQEKT
jgi:RNA polymerase sigma factor (TIGR02999 family)